MYYKCFDILILEFTVSGPHDFKIDSIILQNSKFRGQVDEVKKMGKKNIKWELCMYQNKNKNKNNFGVFSVKNVGKNCWFLCLL